MNKDVEDIIRRFMEASITMTRLNMKRPLSRILRAAR